MNTTIKKILLFLILTMFLAGCGELIMLTVELPRQALGINVRRITIFDLQSNEEISFRRDIWGFERIVRIDERERTFQTLNCEYKMLNEPNSPCDHLILRTFDYMGRVVSEIKLPPLIDMGPIDLYSLSLGGRYFCYY